MDPIRALQSTVESVAHGDYELEVPFTGAADETGALARSIDVLKRGAAAVEEQRWIKVTAAKIANDLQGAISHAEFGQRLLAELVPALGGGIAGFYGLAGGHDRLLRLAGYGLGADAQASSGFGLGEGLAGQCALACKPAALTNLPPDYFRISSGRRPCRA